MTKTIVKLSEYLQIEVGDVYQKYVTIHDHILILFHVGLLFYKLLNGQISLWNVMTIPKVAQNTEK